LIHRIALGVLCTATAGAAALGITLHPSSIKDSTVPTMAMRLDSARMSAVLRANRDLPRQMAPAFAIVAHAPVPLKPKPAPYRPAPLPSISGLTASQVVNAWAIVWEGHQMGISPRGQVIAMATALQESKLFNYTRAVDHDSLGIFQQRPSSGWGTPRQITTPTYAAHAFYSVLLQYRSAWGCLTCAAQDVQRSAFPGAYAKWEGFASQIVTILDRRFP
jgi:hypothetical protein